MGFAIFLGFLCCTIASEALSSQASFLRRKKNPTSRELYERTRAVLEHFRVPDEKDYSETLQRVQSLQTWSGLKKRLEYFDLNQSFFRLSKIDHQKNKIDVFRDIDSRQVLDFSVLLRPENTPIPWFSLNEHLKAAKHNPKTLPLRGIKIAIDPGHMGGVYWDLLTGKYIRDAKTNRTLSEGVLNLQTSILLAQRLRSRGAEVLLTRTLLNSVTKETAESIELQPLQQRELRSKSLMDWFRDLLLVGPAGPTLYRAFEKNAEVKDLFSDHLNNRTKYLISREDLGARVKKIREFEPDVTLVIHFDTSVVSGDSNGVSDRPRDGTKAYVPGAFLTSDYSTRESRAEFVEHLLDPIAWSSSVRLSELVTQHISSELGVPFDPYGGSDYVKKVAPGVYTRNLYVTSRLPRTALCYLESFYYNDPKEFEMLLKTDQVMKIGDQEIPYSHRLVQLSRAIENALIEFVLRAETL